MSVENTTTQSSPLLGTGSTSTEDRPKAIFHIALYSIILGALLVAGIAVAVMRPSFRALALYASALATFHALEFLLTAYFHPDTVSLDAFLLENGTEYLYSILAALLEYALEALCYGSSMKRIWLLQSIGYLCVLVGQAMRTTAMVTAAGQFSHTIRHEQVPGVRLITNGIYGMIRHPGYAGFFLWAIGTQILLNNPVTLAAYLIVLERFFAERIRYEEATLLRSYGDSYRKYMETVPGGIVAISNITA